MPRPKHPGRLEEIADAALAAFSSKGFRLTQVADIARQAGVAPGTIYLFAESKEALFWLSLARSMGQPLQEVLCAVPTVAELRKTFAPNGASPSLTEFIANQELDPPPFEAVLREFYETVELAAPAINLVERCAGDWPELAEAFYLGMRSSMLQNLTKYLERASEKGICRSIPNPPMAARIIMETIAWFAMHRRGDVDGRYYDDSAAREATIDAMLHAFAQQNTQTQQRQETQGIQPRCN